MDPRTLATPTPPATPAWEELARLLDRRQELAAGVDALDAEQRAATAGLATASAGLADLERRALGGETVNAEQRKRAEQQLARAKDRAAQPWQERRAGARAAIADADGELSRYLVEHFQELADGLAEQGREAAGDVDRAAVDLLAAFTRREQIASRMAALCTQIRPVRPGDISRSRGEAVAAQCQRLLDQGGEAPVELVHDPRQPRYSEPEQVAT